MPSIDYYDHNAKSFYERTIQADLAEAYKKFLAVLSRGAHILDAGCGVGRDVKYFLSQKYVVSAFDPSQAMVDLTSQETGIKAHKMTFQDMNFSQEFDGVWASLSLIHVPYTETKAVYKKIHTALKPGGIFYGSYKYGTECMKTPGRDFYNMTEVTLLPYFEGLFEVIEIWKEKDTRSKESPSADKQLLHFVVRRTG